MNSSTLVGNPNIMVAGPPPPPPPPPPVSGHLPAMRINTAENAAAKRPQVVSNDVYEPPAAIQNAMLTKDKKPFTYTPGMGGKLDLSQIRSPRMARRVAKNANDEGIEGPPKSAIESKQSPAVSPAANLLVPQVAVPVFPSNVPPQPYVNRMSQSPSVNRTLSNAVDKQAEPAKNIMKVDTKIVPVAVTSSQSSTPESPTTPTQVTLVKAPTPWLQNKNKPQEELPEWAKRTNVNKMIGSDPSEDSFSPVQVVQIQQLSPQCSQAKQKQEQKQYSTPQYQQTRSQQLSQQPQQQRRNTDSVTSQQTNLQSPHERVVPIRIDDRPSVFDVKRESGHHQFKQPPTLHHQQRWGQAPAQLENQAQNQKQSQIHVTSPSEQSAGTTYIIPLVMEGSEKRIMPPNTENNIKIGKPTRIVQQRSPDLIQQHEPGPIQSRSFRVLQKITDTDEFNDGSEQIRRMELSEDEKLLMNKFKEQVDQETYLHQEKDPRYRGAAIPSRAFRFLQNMTESNDTSVSAAPHNVQNVANKRQNRNSKSFEETQANLPPSEQQVQEPKKYTGSAIPSRSFRILQAMTATENDATQENRQADYTCRTGNNLPGNQQDAFFSPRPVSFWSHSEGWWGYYPVPYNAPPNKPANEADERSFPYLRYPDENACVGYKFFYPVYDENFADVARIKVLDQENSLNQYDYVTVICPQSDHNDVQSDVDTNNCIYNRCTTLHSALAQNNKYFLQNSVSESRNTLPNEINHLDTQSNGTYNPKSSCESYDSDKNCLMTAMNIVDEENGASDRPNKTSNNIEKSKKTFGLHINVPNYTYIDTSDSSDSSDCSDSNDCSDSSDSISDNEHLSDSCQKYCNDTTSNNMLSNSDSDSYEGYSMDLNPYEKLKRNPSDKNCADPTAHSECSIDIDNSCRHSQKDSDNSSDKILPERNQIDYSNDRNSCVTLKQDLTKGCNEEGYTDNQGNLDSCSSKTNSADNSLSNTEPRDQENPRTDNASHRLSIIYEDAERLSSESLYCESKRRIDGQNKTSLEVIDDPPDDAEAMMVSVSLPLKFRFSVSEDNEDITTVTVGNSEIKAERSCGGYFVKNDKNDDVCVNFHVGNDTSVDFTVKRHTSEATCATASTRDKTSIETAVPYVDFTFKKDPTSINGSNCKEQNTETEFPVAKMECHRNFKESVSKNADDCITDSESVIVTRDKSINDGNCIEAESANNFDVNETTAKSELVTSERSWMRDFETLQVPVVDANQTNQKNCCVDSNDDRCVDSELCQTDTKYLLSVQDSREDTDDEDSGVTSDISRMISEIDAECREIDTDSEYTVSKNPKKYQRTQTHSRLFRLLNDDSNLSDRTSTDPGTRKEYLSLPLRTNTFNYDDSYCSNYSSGLTSPEYSPIHEQSCRKFHDTATSGNTASLPDVKLHHPAQQPEQIPSRDNLYFRNSVKLPNLHENDVIPSLAFKMLNSKTPFWTYKVNVLCPRIKSTKSVPQALLARQIDKN